MLFQAHVLRLHRTHASKVQSDLFEALPQPCHKLGLSLSVVSQKSRVHTHNKRTFVLHVSLGHSLDANVEQIRSFSGICQVLVKYTQISFPERGMCILFEICEKRPFQKCMG